MARSKQEIESTKQVINTSLRRILDEYQTIDAEMAKVSPKRGIARQSLCSRTGQHVMHSVEGISAVYIDPNEHRYTIQIRRE